MNPANSHLPVVLNLRFGTNTITFDGTPGLDLLLECWQDAVPETQASPDVDREDWIEMAVRLTSAMQICPDRVALLNGAGQAILLKSGAVIPPGASIIYLGAWSRGGGEFAAYRVANMTTRNAYLAERYASLATFQRFAGRQLRLCGLLGTSAPGQHLFDAVAELSSDAPHGLMIKVNRAKYAPLTRITVPAGCSREVAGECISRQAGDVLWAGVHHEGEPDAFLVQQFQPMHAEYRVFVINHQPVAGAGCIEHHTPLNNKSTWDQQVEWVRGDGIVVSRLDLVEAYQAFADDFVQALRTEAPECRSYVLDLATKDDGSVCAIELNPNKNTGLYALDYLAVLRAEVGQNFSLDPAISDPEFQRWWSCHRNGVV